MEIVADLIKVLVPASLVLWAMYLTLSSFLRKEFAQKNLEQRFEAQKTVLPIRLEAYERICLLLERMLPNNLLIRLSNPEFNVVSFQQVLIAEIRAELAHNFSQQLYISDDAWLSVKNALNETISMINLSAQELDPNAPSIELSKKVIEKVLQNQHFSTESALAFVKDEARKLF
jgi:hypothetical protein